MIYIVRTVANHLVQVEATSQPHACQIATSRGHQAHSAWLKDQTEHAARRSLKRVLAHDYIDLTQE